MMSKSINENVVTDSENKEKKIAKPRQKKISKPLTPESPAVISNEDELIEPIEEILESVVSTKGLVTKGESSRLVLGQRVAYPGDYVVHEKVCLQTF